MSHYNDFKKRKQSTCDKIKGYIETHYADEAFKEYYDNFKPLLDYLVDYFFPQSAIIQNSYSEKILLQGKSENIVGLYKNIENSNNYPKY